TDAAGKASYDTAELNVQEVSPDVQMAITPASGGCGGSTILMSGSFTDANPFDTGFTVGIDWDYNATVTFDQDGNPIFPPPPAADEMLPFTKAGHTYIIQ